MERPKQQAIAFLLGALLVGGALGFSADRVFRSDELTPAQRRAAFYEDIGITVQQRPVLDSLLDDRNCRMDSVVKTIQPALDSILDDRNCRMDSVVRTFQPTLDSIKSVSRVQIDRVLTAEQHARVEVRRKDEAARHAADRQRQKPPCGK